MGLVQHGCKACMHPSNHTRCVLQVWLQWTFPGDRLSVHEALVPRRERSVGYVFGSETAQFPDIQDALCTVQFSKRSNQIAAGVEFGVSIAGTGNGCSESTYPMSPQKQIRHPSRATRWPCAVTPLFHENKFSSLSSSHALFSHLFSPST